MTALPGMNWTADVDAICGVQITEIDMRDAGMTVARADGLLDGRTLAALEALPKAERSVEIGRISRARSRAAARGEPSLAELITRGIRSRIEAVLEQNGVGPDRLLSVKRDAVFVTGPPPGRLVLPDGSAFRAKGAYSAFARFGAVELYCSPRRGTWDLKGVAEDRRHLHAQFCVRFAMDVLGMAESGAPEEAAETVRQFRDDYAGLRLPLGFYRELNASSSFCVLAGSGRFLMDYVGEEFPRDQLDPVYNLRHVIITLARALV